MNQKIIAITGISGVGKTTFIRNLAERFSFQHLTGGSLIARAKDRAATTRDKLRLLGLDENQRLLIEGFMAARDHDVETVIFDGHAVIDGLTGLASIPVGVFEAIGVCLMVHLEADPLEIQHNRTRDSDRLRPTLSPETLYFHQQYSRQHAMAIAEALKIDCLVMRTDDPARLENYLNA